MARYLISFADGTMNLSPDELAQAAIDSHAVVDEAKQAGVWVFGGGIDSGEVSGVTVSTDGRAVPITEPARRPPVGGFSIVDVASYEEACGWAAKIAAGCRCEQEVWELMPDDAM
ncbi:hypothetical protein KV102_00160 [Mumia sp. zg.B53]|uniref:YciI family protein n=1 Tax=unclassified Mumia TaxID=2621872 RepID=UPI001C6EAAE3|nr:MULTISPECIES: hypothetical protein [unclassified Mumia]MBW9205365.1 hypothetical protein [Mumia sp. zg.B17]MBW9213238.1 hypothetical protein [Mumia sp. zg.B53]